MRVHISYTVDVDDRYRRALSHHFGRAHPATREELKRHFEQNGQSMDDDLLSEYDESNQPTED